jgi:hypothetical protein
MIVREVYAIGKPIRVLGVYGMTKTVIHLFHMLRGEICDRLVTLH